MIHPLALAQFKGEAVGTSVTQVNPYLDLLLDQVMSFSFPEDGNDAGQGFIPIPGGEDLVLPGVAPRTLLNETTGVIREHRGEKQFCLDRTKTDIGRADLVAAIVYTLEAYLKDPQVTAEDKKSAEEGPYTHVLINTLGIKGPKAPVGPHRFVRNVAGGNRRYLSTGKSIVAKAMEAVKKFEDEEVGAPIESTAAWAFCKWAGNQTEDAELREKAQEVLVYWGKWVTVG